MPGLLQIHLMGHYTVLYNNLALATLDADRIRSLLAWLLLNRGKPVRRQDVAFRLWPDTTEEQARTNLRNLLHQLRTALPEPDLYLETTRHNLLWREIGPYILDVAEFERALNDAEKLHHEQASQQALERAVQLYGGELLPGAYDEWLEVYRENLRAAYSKALSTLMTTAETAGAWQTALQWAERLRQHDALNEQYYVHLMRIHARSGNPKGVEQAYQTCIKVLHQELRVEPSLSTQTSYREWQAFIPNEAVPQITTDRPSTFAKERTLPTLITPLVGRTSELEQINTLLQDPNCRLLTIVGPGGMGKTSLALAFAQFTQSFADGVSFIALAPLESASHLIAVIAEELGLISDQQRSIFQQVVDELRHQEWLLILDNAEHLLEGIGILAELLSQTTALNILVTSRERLNLRNEWILNLTGLTTPPIIEIDELRHYSAIQLFIQSAQRADRQFEITSKNQQAIVQICQLVEGLPLAIELAAAWVRVLAPEEIAREIELNLDFLASEARDLPTRHRSLRAVFDHSWQLLTDNERTCLARLAVFRGSFTRQAAEYITEATLFLLSSLVDKSLVRRESDGRYSLHPLIYQYAAQQHQTIPADQQATEERFIQYYAELLATWKQPLQQSRDRQTLKAVHKEIDNLRQWIHWALAFQRYEALLRGTETLALFYETFGWFHEGEHLFGENAQQLALLETTHQWHIMTTEQQLLAQQTLCLLLAKQAVFEQLLGKIENLRTTLDQLSVIAKQRGFTKWNGEVLRIWGSALRHLGNDPQACQETLIQAITSYEKHGDILNAVCTMFILADSYIHHGKTEIALSYLERGLTLNQQLNNSYAQALLISEMGVAYTYQSQTLHLAPKYFKEALDLFRNMDDALGIIRTANNIGMVYYLIGYPQDGLPYLQEALTYGQHCQSFADYSAALDTLASIYMILRRYTEAQAVWQDALNIATKVGWSQGLGWACNGLGRIALEFGRYEQAEMYLPQAVEHMRASGDLREIARCIGDLGIFYQRIGDLERAQAHYHQAISQLVELEVGYQATRLFIHQATLFQYQGAWERAFESIQQSIKIAEQLGQLSILWEARLIQAHLIYLYMNQEQGWQQILALLEQSTTQHERATALYVLWSIEQREHVRQQAYELYQQLYRETPIVEYRERMIQLQPASNS